MRKSQKILKRLASLKLAVGVLASLAVVIATGTIIESRYDAQVASKLVYRTPWTLAVLGLLALNLIAVMIDRWPWKRRHIPFLLAHVGIIVLLTGSLITMLWGVDGSVRIPIGGKNNSVVVNELSFSVWGSFDGERFSKLMDEPVDFFTHSPKSDPVFFNVPEGQIKVVSYDPFVIPQRVVKSSADQRLGSAVRFQMQNTVANVVEWLVQSKTGEIAVHQFGPASVLLGPWPKEFPEANQIYLAAQKKDSRVLDYLITYKDKQRKSVRGVAREGDAIETGWMGFKFRVLRYFPNAEDTWDYEILSRPTAMTMSAIRVAFQGQEHWLGEDDVIKLYTNNAAYFVRYGHRQLPLGFDMQLKNFEVDRYQGTMRAAAYKSVVEVPGLGERVISMNEPLKNSGFTIYQSSFQEDPPGHPVASIFSVNHDPGRGLKYLGSIILSLGMVWLFYDKRKAARSLGPQQEEQGDLWLKS